jgi:hypothetical protein
LPSNPACSSARVNHSGVRPATSLATGSMVLEVSVDVVKT